MSEQTDDLEWVRAQNVLRSASTTRSATAFFASGSLLTLGLGTSAGILGATLLASPAAAATYTVSSTNDSGGGSLRQAIIDANASAGTDTITFNAGLTGTLTLGSDLPSITGGLIITGPGSTNFTISGSDTHHAFEIATGGSGAVTITGLTITNSVQTGSNLQGGAINVIGTGLTINDVVLQYNSVQATVGNAAGGALAVENVQGDGDVAIIDSAISHNYAETTSPTDQSAGGGLDIEADNILLSGSIVDHNQADFGSGAYAKAFGTSTMTGTSILANGSALTIAGIGIAGENVFIADSVISGNESLYGLGGIYVASFGGSTSVFDTKISDNSGASLAGGIFIATGGETTLDRVTITENLARTSPLDPANDLLVGGAVVSGSASISNSTIADNTGAGLSLTYGLSTGSLAASILSSAVQPTVNAPTDASVSINHSTITGNSLEGIAEFGGYGCGPVSVANTVATCSTSSGGGLSPSIPGPTSVALVLDHVLAADNGREDVAIAANASWSLLENANAAVVAGEGTILGVDPGLLPLTSINDTVSVVPISFGSAAWNAGNPGFVPPPDTDQRGLPRVVDIIDIGAYEVQEALQFPKFTG